MKKRILLTLSIMSACSVMLAGCGGSTANAPAAENADSTSTGLKEGGSVTISVWSPEDDAELMEQIKAGFQAEHPGTSITFDEVAHETANMKSDILADVNAAPDVFIFADDQLSGLVASGVLKGVSNS